MILLTSRLASLLAFLVLLPAVLSQSLGAAWIPLGPIADQPIESVTVLPAPDAALLVVGTAGVFRSVGGDFHLLNGDGLPLGATGRLHTAGPPGSPILYLTGSEGVFESSDRGETWSKIHDASGPRWDLALGVSPLAPDRLYLITEVGLELSQDGGRSWTVSESFPFLGDFTELLGQLEVAPSDPDVIYATAHQFDDRGLFDTTVLIRSWDGGTSWNQFAPDVERRTGFGLLAVDPTDPAVLYINVATGVWRSTDGGETWSDRSAGLPSYTGSEGETLRRVRTMAIDPRNPAILYAGLAEDAAHGLAGGVFRSTDGGESWSAALGGLPLPLSVTALTIDPADSTKIYAVTPEGTFVTGDRGATWQPFSVRLPIPMAAVAIDPSDPATLLSRTSDFRLFRSETGGVGWRRVGFDLPVDDWLSPRSRPEEILRFAPSDPAVVYLASTSIHRSTDRGLTWRKVGSRELDGFLKELIVDPRDPDVLFADRNPVRQSLSRSTDGGATWKRIHDDTVEALAQSLSDPDVLYAGGYVGGPQSELRGVCRSADHGDTWTCSVSGLVGGHTVTALAVDPRDPSLVLAALSFRGSSRPSATVLQRSLDGGATWEGPAPGFSDAAVTTALVFDGRRPGVVWAGTDGAGVFRSDDGGASWTSVNDGLLHLGIEDLALEPESGSLLAATPMGIFRHSPGSGPAPPPPPAGGWITDGAFPDFRFNVQIEQGGGTTITGAKEPACLPETVCVSGAVPGRSEVFARVVGPKPNGRLWPTLVKFSTSRVEIWIQQLSTGELRYYELRGAAPGFDELPGLFDREGFLP